MLVLAISAAGALAVFFLLRYIVKTRLVPETQMHQRLRKLKYGAQVQTERVGEPADVEIGRRDQTPRQTRDGAGEHFEKVAAAERQLAGQKARRVGKRNQRTADLFRERLDQNQNLFG